MSTVAQYEAAITAALQARDIEAIPGLLLLMSREHPREAHDLLAAMRYVSGRARPTPDDRKATQ
jgi:hypothetical protein